MIDRQLSIQIFTSCIYLPIQQILIESQTSMETDKELRTKFLKAIDGDTPMTKLWKYRAFVQNFAKEAPELKEKMLDLAIKNKLIGEYELIFRLLGVPLSSIPRSGQYGRLKDELIPVINSLKIEAQNYQSVSKVEEQVKTYFKLGEMLAGIGDHKDSERFYSKIIRRISNQNIVKDQDLLPQWGRELFYMIDDPQGNFNIKESHDYSELEVFAMRELADKKKMTSTLALIRDTYRLTKKGRGKGKMRVFENLRSEHFSTQHIINNGIFSLMDLGFLYSIISLAHSTRDTLKKDIKWSSKVQIAYLQTDYKKLFNDIQREYNNYGRFNPTIRFVYEDCFRQINKRVLKEVLSAYQMISLKKIEQLTNIRGPKVEQFLREHTELPYLYDPITQSVVYYEKNVPLYEEAEAFYQFVKEKYEEKARAIISDSREDMEEFDFQSKGGPGSGYKRMSYPRTKGDKMIHRM